MTSFQKAAALAALQVLFAGCSSGTSDTGKTASASPPSSSASAPAKATVPTISAQPAAASVNAGATATLSVTASGSNLFYQWLKNGAPILGATSATYTTPALTLADDGSVFTVSVYNTAGNVTSAAATVHVAAVLSADQQAAESFAANGGVYEFGWLLNPVTGGAQVSGTDFLTDNFAVLLHSPAVDGPQTLVQSPSVSLASSLAVVTGSPSRALVGGAFVLVPGESNSSRVSYVGTAIQVDNLDSNGNVAYSQVRSNFVVVPLTGLLHSAPTALTQPFNAVFGNADVLDTTTSWASGAAFYTYTATQKGDKYAAFDCEATTSTQTPSSCTNTSSATTLTAFMTAGITSHSDSTTYHLTDGAIVTVSGVPIWVATNPRPAASVGNSTTEYRIYFQLNGLFYTGALTRDGTTIASFHYYDDPTNVAGTLHYLNYQVRLNAAAAASLKAGTKL